MSAMSQATAEQFVGCRSLVKIVQPRTEAWTKHTQRQKQTLTLRWGNTVSKLLLT